MRASRRSHTMRRIVAVRFVVGLLFVGWLFSRKGMVQFFNQLHPVVTLLIWYSAFYVFVLVVFWGVPFFGNRFNYVDAFSITLLTFAFMLVWNMAESPWGALASGRNPQEIPNVYIATEDGVVWLFWQGVVLRSGLTFPQWCLFGLCLWPNWYDLVKDLTYIVTPAIMLVTSAALLGVNRLAIAAHKMVT